MVKDELDFDDEIDVKDNIENDKDDIDFGDDNSDFNDDDFSGLDYEDGDSFNGEVPMEKHSDLLNHN